MKLPVPQLSLIEALAEFDIWITPSLGEITDTDLFKREVERIALIFDSLGSATRNFARPNDCSPEVLASAVTDLINGKTEDERREILQALGAMLFLVTGKSDNNSKCQFPLYLRDTASWSEIPAVSKNGKLSMRELPRTIKADDYMALIAKVTNKEGEQRLLEQFLSFLLKDERAVSQLWSVGHGFYRLKEFGHERDLLAPLVVFKIRGSVTASGGHEPEQKLRSRVEEWGLLLGTDCNIADVIVQESGAAKEGKTRAYDFVLPYQTPGWAPPWEMRLLIQCQFYAGDSGSVSHKNVDQTAASRAAMLQFLRHVRFVEYVDGAGYFSSLNGDLRNLLAMETTAGFFQLRSAAVRLRRELQTIGFVTPLEIEQALARSNNQLPDARGLLVSDGYSPAEVDRAIQNARERGILQRDKLSDSRRDLVRRYLLLDVIACRGHVIQVAEKSVGGRILIPGYGPFYGMPLDEMIAGAIQAAPLLADDLQNSTAALADVRWLCEQGLALAR